MPTCPEWAAWYNPEGFKPPTERTAVPNTRPNAAKNRARALLKKGLSEREVLAKLQAEGIRASKGSIGNWKREAASGAPPGQARPRVKKAKPADPGEAPPPIPAPPGAASPAATDEWTLEGVDLVALPAELLERLGRKFAARIGAEVDLAVIDPQVLGALMRDYERISKALVLARPPVEKDPEKDPASLEMAAIAIGHVKRMIEDVRKARAKAAAATP